MVRSITDNWPAKILSIMLAVFLFIFQRVNTLDTRVFEVPITVVGNTNALVSTSPLPTKARVTITTTQNELPLFSEKDVSAHIDLSKFANPGTYTAPIEVMLPADAQDIDSIETHVQPIEIKITLDKKAGKYFSVNPVFRGIVAPGYELVSQDISPDKVWIEGPASVIGMINAVSTEGIDITGRDTAISREVRLETLNPVLTSSHYSFRFNAEIKSIEKSAEWDAVPIVFINLDEGLAVAHNNYTGYLRLQGNERDISGYTPKEGVLYVDCSQISSEGEYPSMYVQHKVGDEYRVLKVEPETVSITVEKAADAGLEPAVQDAPAEPESVPAVVEKGAEAEPPKDN
jgi:hypothetical protein